MKIKLVLSALLGCGLLFSNSATAKLGNNSGNPVPRNETLDAKFVLVPTPDGPAGSKGTVQLRAQRNDTDQTATLSIQTTGLAPGDYLLTAARASDGSSADIGHFLVEDTGKSNAKSQADLDVPSGIDPTDIAKLGVWDSNFTLLFIGDMTDTAGKSKETLNATVPVTPGVAAPDATGSARLKSSVKKGVRKTSFTMVVSGVPTNSTFSVDVDGADGGTVTSNSKGKVMVKGLPDGIDTVGTVRLLDDTAAEVARADF